MKQNRTNQRDYQVPSGSRRAKKGGKSKNLLNEAAPTLISLELLTPRGFSQVRTMLLALTTTAVRFRARWLSPSDRRKSNNKFSNQYYHSCTWCYQLKYNKQLRETRKRKYKIVKWYNIKKKYVNLVSPVGWWRGRGGGGEGMNDLDKKNKRKWWYITSMQNFMIICLTLHISLHANIMSSTV